MTASFEPWFNFLVCVILVIATSFPSHAGNDQDIGIFGDTNQGYFFYQQSEYPRDCQEVLQRCSLLNSSGVYVIKPAGYPEPFEVYCKNEVNSSGWTVVQRRIDSSVNFNRTWTDYRDGFGFLSNNFWLGNEKLSFLTNQAVYQLHVNIELSYGSSVSVSYNGFRISDEWDNYTVFPLESFGVDGDWSITSCPRNMIYGSCACRGTCKDPDGSSGCQIDCELGNKRCFCPYGFVVNGEECVLHSECPCFWSGVNLTIPNGQSYVNDDCTERRNCSDNQLTHDEGYRCDSNADCAVRDGVRQCHCNEGYEGDGQSCRVYRDCYDAYANGHTQYGVYTILPADWTGPPFNVSCVMNNEGGWTVFQRRTGSDRSTNFYLDWTNYREGFGSLDGDFWLGNEKLHHLTRQNDYQLRVDVVTSSNSALYAEYTSFETANSSDNYRLSVSGYSGNAGDSLYHHNGKAFSTYDSDNDACGTFNCAAKGRGGWWYTNTWCSLRWGSYCHHFSVTGGSTSACAHSNLNGDYNGGNGQNIFWYFNANCHLNSAEMKIRPSM